MQHTKGTWKAYHGPRPNNPQGDKRIMVLHPDGERLIACCSVGITSNRGTIPEEERHANASLIAAAPDLLDALRKCSDLLCDLGQECTEIEETGLSVHSLQYIPAIRNDAIKAIEQAKEIRR